MSASKTALAFRTLLFAALAFAGCGGNPNADKKSAAKSANLKLPEGFTSVVAADSVGPLRHISISDKGVLYVKLSRLKEGKGIFCLHDADNDGYFEQANGFGDYAGTGIRVVGNTLYASSNSSVFRYALNENGDVADTAKKETIVQGLPDLKMDNAKSFALDGQDHIYVAIGSPNENCTPKESVKGMPGCPLRDSLGGIWQFSTKKQNQTYGDGLRYATGLKNVVGLDWDTASGVLFAASHGRGNLGKLFPKLYTQQQDGDLPAEAVYGLHQGSDAGWPFVYYDQQLKKNVQSPEYGGNGKKEGDKKFDLPAFAMPAHMGPNDLLFYTGDMFPERYKNGVFVALHGQSPTLRQGYFVAFVPFKDGKPSGEWEIFADGFAGIDLKNPKSALEHRPMGLTQGPDGSLYVGDDVQGTIYKISYKKS
ncbi:MAG: PQQ-dependent sugar dehydrogenase [Mucilaginibacter polytrichastri]|nr:PQQ-dependent sugar dehydrogenase [Mucilaginibacter polytrichastri]